MSNRSLRALMVSQEGHQMMETSKRNGMRIKMAISSQEILEEVWVLEWMEVASHLSAVVSVDGPLDL